MSATVTHAPAPTATRHPRTRYRVTGIRVLRSEWTKLWSLRSTWITLGLGLLFLVGFGVVAAVQYRSKAEAGQTAGTQWADATTLSLSLFGIDFAELALGVLGVLMVAGEYSTGTIRSTLSAVPRRLPVLWSKVTVYGVVALITGTAGAFATFLIDHRLTAGTAAVQSITDAGVLRALVGAGLYLALVGVIGAALGATMRSVAGSVAVLIGVLLLLPSLVSLLPHDWQDPVSRYLPSNAGQAMFALHHDTSTLSPAAGLLVLLGWTVLALAAGAYRLARTDA
ncbi:putative ABC transporter, membrane protein [Nocardia nova SH22a]|uniref:Putative ABC transporter, membrane protein n=1 Tax=Nocardia nova SH22a TaxID=1415166 RepID=W5TH24_9NOCA|nr:ABC transporter permease subunit [Nocardia nova]AHH18670.1 putative ABC transporter, membrane protein [Nocardia nova SH22a]